MDGHFRAYSATDGKIVWEFNTIREFETHFYGWLERKQPAILAEIRDKKELSDTLRDQLTRAVTDAKAEFTATKGIKAA